MPCTTLLIGKKVSYDGSTIIARNDDGGFDTKKLVIVEPDKQPRKYKCVISHLEIELEDNPLRYSMCPNVSPKEGTWGAFGINSMNVGMTATETISSNVRVLSIDPYVTYIPAKDGKEEVPGGIGEEDIVSLTLPYIKTAREGVIRLGKLLEKYGTYEPNGLAFSDENEIWWFESIGGHHWIAKKAPEDKVVIMPNQFGLDNFDFNDAYGKQTENMCSKDLKDFMIENNIDCNITSTFNPRLAFGSHTFQDHLYNTPRAWYIARYLNPRKYTYDGPSAYYTPESDDLPWSIEPDRKISIEEIRYLLTSHYQGTPYDPYSKSNEKGKYRSIGVPGTDDCGIVQIRNNVPDEIKGVIWVSMGGGVFAAAIPQYTNVSKFPKFLSETTEEVSTDYLYWCTRLFAIMVDANYANTVVFSERYQFRSLSKGSKAINETDKEFIKTKNLSLLEETNEKIAEEFKKDTIEVIGKIINIASENMKTKYHRSDN
ncbi:C69 family dipeptidase [bacterium]|nr:C69 family dipeptidase [bacterium]